MVNGKIKAWEGRLSMVTKPKDNRRGGGSIQRDVLVYLSANSGGKSKRGKDVLRISFHPRLMHMAGWDETTPLDVEFYDGKGTVFPFPEGRPAKKLTAVAKRSTIVYFFDRDALKDFPSGAATGVEVDKGIVAFVLPR